MQYINQQDALKALGDELEKTIRCGRKERDFISAGSARTEQESGCLQRVKKPEEYTNGLT